MRLENVSMFFEHGRVFLHSSMLRLRDELVMFPRGDHDDELDVLVGCLTYLKEKHIKQRDWRIEGQGRYIPKGEPHPVTGRLR